MTYPYQAIMRLAGVCLVAVALWSAADSASAATYYVSPTGTDDGSHGTGTGNDAWRTLDYALRGQRVAKGDTINIEAGTYSTFNGADTNIFPDINVSTGSGPVLIKAYPNGASVTLDMPSNSDVGNAFIFLSSSRWTELRFQHIHFTNSSSVNTRLFWLYGHKVTLEDCSIDMNSTGNPFYFGNDTEQSYLTVRRTTFTNTSRAIYQTRDDRVGVNITVESSLFYGNVSGSQVLYMPYAANLDLRNNTFITDQYLLHFAATGSQLAMHNNLIYNNSGVKRYPVIFEAGSTAFSYFRAHPDQWKLTNNAWYTSSGGFLDLIWDTNSAGIMLLDHTNHWLDPQFTNAGGNDYSLQSGTYLCGRGSGSLLPAGGDINGQSWTGNDVGAYKCPTATASITPLASKTAFVGDSIMNAMAYSTAATAFDQQTHTTHVAGAYAAVPGANMQWIFAHLDTVMTGYAPQTVYLSIGINNLASNSMLYNTAQQHADYIVEIMRKIEQWGATPIWLGIGSLNNYGSLSDTNIPTINNLVKAACVTHGWQCASYLDQMMLNAQWQSASPNGYYDTNGDVHPNSLGHGIIGMVADYLFFNRYTMGTNQMDIAAGARVYADGAFRHTAQTASGVTANLVIRPSTSFHATSKAPWMDVTFLDWNTSGTYYKKWTEASTTIGTGSTVHVVGDMAYNTYYAIKVNGSTATGSVTGAACASGVCLSSATGSITFTYTGGYSTKTFEVERGDNTAPVLSGGSLSGSLAAGATTTTLSVTTDEAATCKYGVTSGTAYASLPSTFTGTGTSHTALLTGLAEKTTYFYYVRCQDTTGNRNTSDYTISFSTPAASVSSEASGGGGGGRRRRAGGATVSQGSTGKAATNDAPRKTVPRPDATLPKAAPASSALAAPRSRVLRSTFLRSGPSTKSDRIVLMLRSWEVTVEGKEGDWLRVSTASGKRGYVFARNVEASASDSAAATGPSARATVTAYALNVRTGPALDARPISKLSRGSVVNILHSIGQWRYIRLSDGREGYVVATYLRPE